MCLDPSLRKFILKHGVTRVDGYAVIHPKDILLNQYSFTDMVALCGYINNAENNGFVQVSSYALVAKADIVDAGREYVHNMEITIAYPSNKPFDLTPEQMREYMIDYIRDLTDEEIVDKTDIDSVEL